MATIQPERMGSVLAACRANPAHANATLATYVAAAALPAGGTWLHQGLATGPLAGAAGGLPPGCSLVVVADGSDLEMADIHTAVRHLRDCRPDVRIKVVRDDPATWFRASVVPCVVFVGEALAGLEPWQPVCSSFYGMGAAPAGAEVLAPNIWSLDATVRRAGGGEAVPGSADGYPADRPGDSGHAGSDWSDTCGL